MVAMAVAMLSSVPAKAELVTDRSGSTILQRTTVPYWQVGTPSPYLSQLCVERQFNQVKLNKIVIEFVGEVGRGRLGVAQSDWNLHDPQDVLPAGTSVYFSRDRTTGCTVYYFGEAPRQPDADPSRPLGPEEDQQVAAAQ